MTRDLGLALDDEDFSDDEARHGDAGDGLTAWVRGRRGVCRRPCWASRAPRGIVGDRRGLEGFIARGMSIPNFGTSEKAM